MSTQRSAFSWTKRVSHAAGAVLCGAAFICMVLPGFGAAAGGGDTAQLEKELARAKSLVMQAKLQEALRVVTELEQKIDQSRSSLGKKEASSYDTRLARIKELLFRKEDSLVNKNIEILRANGPDSAFQFLQTVVWQNGVSKTKMDSLENIILNEAPAASQTQQRDEIAHTMELLESGAPIDPNADPYVLKTARLLLQARQDSLMAAQKAGGASPPVPARVQEPEMAPVPPPEEKKIVPPAPTPSAPQPVITPAPAPSPASAQAPVAPEPVASAQAPAPIQQASPAPVQPPPTQPKKRVITPAEEVYESPSLKATMEARAKANQEFLKKLKANRDSSQNIVITIYDLLEKNQSPEAMKLFRLNRGYLAKYIDPQVFNALEQTLVQDTTVLKQATVETPGRQVRSLTPEQKTLDRLNGLIRENKIETAYAEFKRHEISLQNSMEKKEFKMLKQMVEDAYSLRTGVKKK